MTSREVLTSVAAAIYAIDRSSFSPRSEEDKTDIEDVRTKLFGVLERNGYEMVSPTSARIRKRGNKN